MTESGVGTEMPKYRSHKTVHALKIIAVEKIKPTIEELNRILDGSAEMDENPPPAGRLTVEHPFTPIEVGVEFMRKHDPQPGGYYVVYEDGYASWSPAKAFEEGYTRV